MASMPNLVVIAGPNGAGKSTVAPALLRELLGIYEFVNADVIARGLSAFDPESAAIQAGRIMLERIRTLAAERADFAFETTLASRSFAPWIASLIEGGYDFRLVYLWVASPDLCIARIAERVRLGGHHVPNDVVRRRYSGSLRNFFHLYRPLAQTWAVYDNSSRPVLRLVAEGIREQNTAVYDEANWEKMSHGLADADRREA
jgi:predicted ABC-type ATPase